MFDHMGISEEIYRDVVEKHKKQPGEIPTVILTPGKRYQKPPCHHPTTIGSLMACLIQ